MQSSFIFEASARAVNLGHHEYRQFGRRTKELLNLDFRVQDAAFSALRQDFTVTFKRPVNPMIGFVVFVDKVDQVLRDMER